MKNLLLITILFLATPTLHAEVASSEHNGFSITHQVEFPAPPKVVYQAMIGKVAQWWLSDHTWSGDHVNLYVEPRAGGCFCERLPEGGSALHMLITYVQPGREIRMVGGLGPLQMMGLHGGMKFYFTELPEGRTRLDFQYNVSGFAPDGLQGLATIVDGVWEAQLGSLQKFVKGGE